MNSTLKEGARGFKTLNEIISKREQIMQVQTTFFMISKCNVTLTRQLSRINIFGLFQVFHFYASFSFFRCSMKDKVQKRKQTLRTLNLCSKLQRKEKQPRNKFYTQEKGPFNQIQTHRISKTQFICRHMT